MKSEEILKSSNDKKMNIPTIFNSIEILTDFGLEKKLNNLYLIQIVLRI